MNSFTFVVITYNHQEYVLEHLESIKYLVVNYGKDISVNIVLSDDASKDNTVQLAKSWLQVNKALFFNVEILERSANVGVCKSVLESFALVKTEFFKLTAGDDVYSCENLFNDFEQIKNYDIVSGVPLNLLENKIYPSKFNVFNIIATDVIYKNANYIDKLRNISFSFAPAMIYSFRAISHSEVKSFLERFSVIEDLPLHIRMAEIFNPLKFLQVYRVHVYYRRTAGSIYLVRAAQYDKDKIAAFNYLRENNTNSIGRFLMVNRIFCFRTNNKYLKLLCNLGYYIYGVKVLLSFWKILPLYFKFDNALTKHQAHYDYIKKTALKFKSDCNEFSAPIVLTEMSK